MERYLRTVKDTAAVCNIYQHQINRGPLEHATNTHRADVKLNTASFDLAESGMFG